MAFLEDSEGLEFAVVEVLAVMEFLVLGVMLTSAVVTAEVTLPYFQGFEYEHREKFNF